MISLRPAHDLPFPELLDLWNAAYAGYLVPLTFDEAMLRRHIRRSGLDLSRSVVGLVDGRPFGPSLAAFRGRRAWIGGFGVAEPFRRRGLATQLMEAHLARLAEQGVDEVWLEVIDANPAREVYRRCGFAETRTLRMFEGVAPAGDPGRDLAAAELAARHAALNRTRPAWRRDLPTLMDAVEVEGAAFVGVEGGYAVAGLQGERLFVFDAAAADAGAGIRLLEALGARWPGTILRLVDEPEATPFSLACSAAGFANPLTQIEMVRPTSET